MDRSRAEITADLSIGHPQRAWVPRHSLGTGQAGQFLWAYRHVERRGPGGV